LKTFPAAFTIEKNKKTGAKPIWIARLITSAADYYLAGRVISIPGFVGSSVWPASTPVITLAWVSSFGNVVEGINGAIDEFKVSEMSITTIIDPEATLNIETLVLAGIEGCIVELYEWFAACSDPPQRIFVGKVRAVTDYNDTTITFAIQDETIDLEKYYVGTKIDLINAPYAPAESIGQMVPIPFGTVKKVPAVCIYSKDNEFGYIFANRGVNITGVWARNAGLADIDILSYCVPYESLGQIFFTAMQVQQVRGFIETKISTTDAGHAHTTGGISTTNQNTTSALPTSVNGCLTGNKTFDFDNVVGNRTRIDYSITATLNAFSQSPSMTIYINSTSVGSVDISNWSLGTSRTLTGSVAADLTGNAITVGTSFLIIEVTAVARVVSYGTVVDANIAGVTTTVSSPLPADKLSDMILVDLVADCNTPITAGSYIANLAGKVDVVGSGTLVVPTFNGLLNEYQTAEFWLNKMAFECGAWFSFINAVPTFISKLGNGLQKTINTCQIDSSGKRVLSRIKTDINDLINKITLLYNRDWSVSESDKAYNKTMTLTRGDALHERPELFRFYFVIDEVYATAIINLYLSLLQSQKWIATCDFFLDQSEIEFGDVVNLSFIDSTGIVISAEHYPGSYNKIHQITLKVLI
jgi:hypothetical protein